MNYNVSIIFTDWSDEEQKDTVLFRKYVSQWKKRPANHKQCLTRMAQCSLLSSWR